MLEMNELKCKMIEEVRTSVKFDVEMLIYKKPAYFKIDEHFLIICWGDIYISIIPVRELTDLVIVTNNSQILQQL